jgi:signal transduction histidine kinase
MSPQDSKLFAPLTPSDLAALSQSLELRSYTAGNVIFTEGDAGDGLYVVEEGLVEISTLIQEHDRQVLSRVGPGDFFGELAVLDSEPRSATASAQGTTRVWFVPRQAFWQTLERSPRVAIALVQLISLRLRDINRRYLQHVLQAERLTLVGRFARSIVHDLKNPLAIIRLGADLLRPDRATAATLATVQDRIRKQVDRMTHMTNELFEFTRGTSPQPALRQTNFADYFAPLLEDLKAETAPMGIELLCPTPPPAVPLLLDRDRLNHVFYNLSNNAIDAMPGGGRLMVRFALETEMLAIEIEDTGPGLPAEIMDRLFEPFATYGKAKGTGLGLSICKRIIEDHRGTIDAQTAPGRGAMFRIRLPRCR